MNTHITPLNTINEDVNKLLIEQIGVVNTIRFYNQFNTGQGDYVQQHQQLAQQVSLDDIFAASDEQKNH